jgi:hypothetical protein
MRIMIPYFSVILSARRPATSDARRAAKPVIGHIKAEHRMSRNYLKCDGPSCLDSFRGRIS